MTVTDEDRENARVLAALCRAGVGGPRLREDAIAAALAAEREKARAPFLAVARGLEQAATSAESRLTHDIRIDAAERIRRAAEAS